MEENSGMELGWLFFPQSKSPFHIQPTTLFLCHTMPWTRQQMKFHVICLNPSLVFTLGFLALQANSPYLVKLPSHLSIKNSRHLMIWNYEYEKIEPLFWWGVWQQRTLQHVQNITTTPQVLFLFVSYIFALFLSLFI